MSVMKREPQPSVREVLAGLVERVTYQNAENGFCVIRVKARGHRDLVTVIGHAAVISAGEWITASGDWMNDRTHGQQFKARFLKTSAPTSIEGIEKYLASGMIRGIGPVYAKKLLRALGEKVFDVIEAEPDRLREVDGIGPVRANRIAAAWRSRRWSARSWCFCTATESGRRERCASTRPTVPTPSRSCRRIPTAWPATFASRRPGFMSKRRQAHNLKVIGSNPIPATKILQ
jgi:ATP-dependent exoDNAse (exonuclease V) alpha subunit